MYACEFGAGEFGAGWANTISIGQSSVARITKRKWRHGRLIPLCEDGYGINSIVASTTSALFCSCGWRSRRRLLNYLLCCRDRVPAPQTCGESGRRRQDGIFQ